MTTIDGDPILDDTLTGTADGDLIRGLGGNDTLVGAGGGDTMEGGDGADFLYGAAVSGGTIPPGTVVDGADSLNGGLGDDVIRGGDGDDTLMGGDGADNLRGDRGSDTLNGGAGLDYVAYRFDDAGLTAGAVFNGSAIGTASQLILADGLGGTDTLIDVERTVVTGSAFGDDLRGGVGGDNLLGNGGADTLGGGAGGDTLYGGAGDDRVDGGDGADVLRGVDADPNNFFITSGNDTLSGGAGDDDLQGSAGADLIEGGADNDLIVGYAGRDTVRGGSGNDDITATLAAAELDGGDGDDLVIAQGARGEPVALTQVSGGAGDDRLNIDWRLNDIRLIVDGGDGDDVMVLEGADVNRAVYMDQDAPGNVILTRGVEEIGLAWSSGVVFGGANNDRIYGASTQDTLSGGGGDDTLGGRFGGDRLDGGSGSDTADYAGSAAVTVNLGAGTASGGDASGDVLISIERLTGSSFGDTLTGDGAANVLNGAGGADSLNGGAGADTLVGGAGADRFILSAALDSAAAAPDQVTDFESGLDTLDVLALGASARITTVALGASTYVYADADGNGSQDALVIAPNRAVAGSDILTGSSLGVTAFGDAASNSLVGSARADTFIAYGGADTMRGGGGADSFYGGEGADVIVLGVGDSTTSAIDVAYDFTGGADRIDVSALTAAGSKLILARFGGSGFLYIDGNGDGNADGELISYLSLIQGSDLVGTGGLTIFGSSESDTLLRGGTGVDVVAGFDGADTIVGAGGADQLYGGAGADTFRYELATDSTLEAYDFIQDFQVGSDTLDLRALNTGSLASYSVQTFGGSTFVYVNQDADGDFDFLVVAAGVTLTDVDIRWTANSASDEGSAAAAAPAACIAPASEADLGWML